MIFTGRFGGFGGNWKMSSKFKTSVFKSFVGAFVTLSIFLFLKKSPGERHFGVTELFNISTYSISTRNNKSIRHNKSIHTQSPF